MKKTLGIIFLVFTILCALSIWGKDWSVIDVVTRSPKVGITLDTDGNLTDDSKKILRAELTDYDKYSVAIVYSKDGKLCFGYDQNKIDVSKVAEFIENSEADSTALAKKYKYEMKYVISRQIEDSTDLFIYTEDFKNYVVQYTEPGKGDSTNQYSASFSKNKFIECAENGTLIDVLKKTDSGNVSDEVFEAEMDNFSNEE